MKSLILLPAMFSFAQALYTPKGSSCAVECGTKAQNFTGTGDLVCLDTAYNDNSKGVLLKQCLTCLGNSTFINSTASYVSNNDQYWYLWHLKYVQQYCLVDTPQTAAAKNCASQCNPMKTALDVSWIYNPVGVQPQYGFCSWNSSQYMTHAKECGTCLQAEEGGVIIGNFAGTTYNACKSQPMILEGDMVISSRNLFESAIVSPSATTMSSTPSSTITSIAATVTPDSPASNTVAAAPNSQPQTSSLSSAAAAGIGVGSALVAVALAAGIFFAIRRRKGVLLEERPGAPSAYRIELGSNAQINEMGVMEKNRLKVSIYEASSGDQYPQELDSVSTRHK